MHLVALLQSSQNADRVLQRRLFYDHRLEATSQRAVLFDAVAVLVESCGSHAAQIPTRKSGLEDVGAVHGASCGACTHQCVKLVDEEDHLPIALLHVLQHTLETLLERPTETGACNHGGKVERHDALVLHAVRHLSRDNALRNTLHDSGFTHAWLTDKCWVVLRAATQHFEGSTNFIFSSNYRIQLSLLRQLSEVDSILC